jgi:spore coat polysaccharide biosynthesis protein SpsF
MHAFEERIELGHRCNSGGRGRVLAFLQARMGSRRLPGKVLMLIQGQTILERAIRRLQAAPIVDGVVVLTTQLDEDDVIVEASGRLGVPHHRGPSQDVLARFQEAAERYRPDIVVRATADNPLLEIGSIERIVDALYWGHLDWCVESGLPYGAATEALTAEALARVHSKAREAFYREHVTLYIKEHPEEFRVSYLEPPDNLRRPQIRLTVDTQEDFAFMNHLIGRLPESGQPVSLEEFLPLALDIISKREGKALTAF